MSDLVRYQVNDFAWDNLEDQRNRTDGDTIRPREVDVGLTATQRFTKFDPKQPKIVRRIDYTAAPTTYVAANSGVPDRRTSQAAPPTTAEQARAVSVTLHHYDTGWTYHPPVGGHVYG